MPRPIDMPELLGIVFQHCGYAALEGCANVCRYWRECALNELRKRRMPLTVAACICLQPSAEDRSTLFRLHLERSARKTLKADHPGCTLGARRCSVVYLTTLFSNSLRTLVLEPTPAGAQTVNMSLGMSLRRSPAHAKVAEGIHDWTGVVAFLNSAVKSAEQRQWLFTLLLDRVSSVPNTENYGRFHELALQRGFRAGKRFKYLSVRTFILLGGDVVVHRPFVRPEFVLTGKNQEADNTVMDTILVEAFDGKVLPVLKFLPMVEWVCTWKGGVYYPYLIDMPERHFRVVGVVVKGVREPPPRTVDVRSQDQFAHKIKFEVEDEVRFSTFKKRLARCVKLKK